LYYYTLVAQALKQQVDAKKVSKGVTDGLKADSSILNQAFSLHIGASLTADDEAKKFMLQLMIFWIKLMKLTKNFYNMKEVLVQPV